MVGRLPGAELDVHHPVHADLLDPLQPLVVDVLPQLHGEARGGGVLGPVELRGVQPRAGLDQQHGLLVRLLQLDQVGLVVNIINLKVKIIRSESQTANFREFCSNINGDSKFDTNIRKKWCPANIVLLRAKFCPEIYG